METNWLWFTRISFKPSNIPLYHSSLLNFTKYYSFAYNYTWKCCIRQVIQETVALKLTEYVKNFTVPCETLPNKVFISFRTNQW